MSSTGRVEARAFSRKRRFKNNVLNVITNPYNLIVLAVIVLLAYLIIVPLIDMLTTTFKVVQRDMSRIPGSKIGDFTLYYWNRLLFSNVSYSLLYKPLVNSLLIASCVSVFSIMLGATLAWLMVRSDLPGKRFFSLAIIVPYMLPSWSKSMAWITVFKNARIGGAPGFLASLGINTPDWLAYGIVPIIIVLVMHYYAYAYLLVSAALGSVNSELEEMGEIIGAGKARILRRITFPLILPAILSSFILTFSKTMGTFGVPAFLGMKVNFNTISTMLYSNVKQRNTTIGFAIAMILIVIAAINVFINQRAIGVRKSFATIGGKGKRSSLIPLGKSRIPVLLLVILFVCIVVMGPILILALDTFMLKPSVYSLENFSLHYWIGKQGVLPDVFEGEAGVLANPRFWKNLWNTLKLVFITSGIATLFGQMTGYITSRGRGKFSGKLVEQLVFIPYLIPSIAFGAMYLAMFATPSVITLFGKRLTLIPSLYGTFAVLILVSVVKHLPFASRAGTANMLQISTELEEAAQVAGVGFFRRMLRIILPLSKNGFMSGLMLILISIMKELDLIVILMTPAHATLPFMAYTYSTSGFPQSANAVAIVMFALVFLFYYLANRFFHADITKGL